MKNVPTWLCNKLRNLKTLMMTTRHRYYNEENKTDIYKIFTDINMRYNNINIILKFTDIN